MVPMWDNVVKLVTRGHSATPASRLWQRRMPPQAGRGLFRQPSGLCCARFRPLMRDRCQCPTRYKARQLWLLNWALLCVFGCICCVPRVAFAGPSSPMCTSFAECAEAPPPEVPPTGGEIRADERGVVDFGVHLDRSHERDSRPLYSQQSTLDPLSIADPSAGLSFGETSSKSWRVGAISGAMRGIMLEIFRPPCARL
jgi:hypothetical protein